MSRSLSRSVLYRRNCLEAFFIESYTSTRAFSQKDTLPQAQKKHEDSKLDFYSSIAASSGSALEMARPYKSMPSVPMIPFLGSSWAYIPLIGRYKKYKLHEADILKKKLYGDVVRESFGKFEMVSSYNPETMKIISENEGTYPSRSEFTCLKVYRQKRKEWFEPDGFLVSQGKEWSDMRESLTRYLSQSNYLKNYLPPLTEIAQDFNRLISLKRDGKKEVDDAMVFLRKWALECVTRVTLDTRLGSLATNLDDESDSMKLLKAVETQLACMYKLEAASGNFPLWRYIPTPTWLKFKKAADVFTSLSYKYINRSINASAAHFSQLKAGESPTFLQHVLLQEKVKLSSAIVTVADLILSGVNKVPCTAGFLLYNLARNPEKQELAYKEVIGLMPKETDVLTPEVYDKLHYLKSCLTESMRLHPTARGNVRVLDRDVVIDGYRVPAGTAIVCVLQLIQRNERYFKNADMFLPERWNSKESKMNEFAYQPFGYGKRSCLGKDLAEMEIVTLTAELLRKFAVEYHYEDVGMFTRLINVPDKPLKLKFVERKQSPRRSLMY